MAAKVEVKWNRKGFYKLRSAPGVQDDLERRAEAIASACNTGSDIADAEYATSSVQGKRRPWGRWRTTVITANAEAMIDNAKNDSLLRNLQEGK